MSGNLEWKTKTVDAEYEFPEWGISCSPLIWNDLIILNLGGENGAVRAYSTKDGKLAWKSDLSGKGVYISSSILNLLGRESSACRSGRKNCRTQSKRWENSMGKIMENLP
jgi:hypothetical protein